MEWMEEMNLRENGRARAREIGIVIGTLPTGPNNAITDVEGVKVGQTTLISGEGPLVVGEGPIRTGVTVIVPREDIGANPLYAGFHSLNGNGEMTGTHWIEEAGLLTTPIAITNTHSVGAVHEAMIRRSVRGEDNWRLYWSLPVVCETYDGILNDINGFHVRAEHVDAAFDAASSGAVEEGTVGGGTGMLCHDFKGGIGTASRRVETSSGTYTVGVLVQANYGLRAQLRIDGVPVGQEIPLSEVPPPFSREKETGSIIIIVATDAPLLPHQCKRLAQRASLGLARLGSMSGDSSGDIFLAFSTGNRDVERASGGEPIPVLAFPNAEISKLFMATVEATEEAIVNALCMATTTTGADNRVAHAIPLDRLIEVMAKYNRLHPVE
jgi:D-aminopeptidase